MFCYSDLIEIQLKYYPNSIEILSNPYQHSIEKKDPRFKSVHSNFTEISKKLDELGIKKVDGVFLDLGVSSYQIDNPERGFSFSKNGPLDMRMDQSQEMCARKWINIAGEEEIANSIYKYGNENMSKKIAHAIV